MNGKYLTHLLPLWTKTHITFENFFIAIGIASMTLLTVPDLRADRSWLLTSCLWCCFAFFVLKLAIKAWTQSPDKSRLGYLISNEGVIDMLAVMPVPIAFLAGVPARITWLLASLWLLKLARRAHGLRCRPAPPATLAQPLTLN